MKDTTKRAADTITSDMMAAMDAAIANAKPAAPKPETWEDFLPMAEQEMTARGIDNAMPCFAEIAAKIKADAQQANGVIFSGCTGSGKTVRARFLAKFCGIRMRSARDMAMDLASRGEITMPQVLTCAGLSTVTGIPGRERTCDIIIDDLGAEPPEFVIFGTRLDLMGLMLEERLEHSGDVKTYITTNLDIDGLRRRYGERVFSRMRQHLVFLRMPNTDRRIGKAYGWT